jgi:hypothetical protein
MRLLLANHSKKVSEMLWDRSTNQVKALVEIPVVEKLILLMHVEGRAHMVGAFVDVLACANGSHHFDKYFQLSVTRVAVNILVRYTLYLIKVKFEHVDCMSNPSLRFVWLWLSSPI